MGTAKVFYDLDIHICVEQNGYATYLAKMNNASCPPYQWKVDDGTNKQMYIFTDIEDAFHFIKVAFEEFKDKFKVISFTYREISE